MPPPLNEAERRDREFFAKHHATMTLEERERYAWLANLPGAHRTVMQAIDEAQEQADTSHHQSLDEAYEKGLEDGEADLPEQVKKLEEEKAALQSRIKELEAAE